MEFLNFEKKKKSTPPIVGDWFYYPLFSYYGPRLSRNIFSLSLLLCHSYLSLTNLSLSLISP